MNRKEAAELLPIIKAFSEGKEIEGLYKGTKSPWFKIKDMSFNEGIIFRIKPETKYRPFKDIEECWSEMQKHQPFGWINKMEKGQIKGRSSIEIVREDGVVLRLENGSTMHFDFKNLTDISYCFSDGTPLGIREEV